MKNQFFYKKVIVTPPKDPKKKPISKTFYDSFNVDTVIRSVILEDGRRLVLLNDIHERTTEQPDINPKTNKVRGMKKIRQTYQSELFLDKEDGDRFKKLTEII